MAQLVLPTKLQRQLGLDEAVDSLTGLISSMRASRPSTRCMHRISLAHEAALCRLAKTHPGAFSARCRHDQSYALHDICKLGPSLQTLKAVYEAFPSAIYKKDIHGQLPIHSGCYHSSSLEVAKFLVQQYPESLSVTDHSYSTPLHNSCYGGLRPIQVDIIAFLLETYPKAASTNDSSDSTPLNALLHNYDGEIPEEAVQLLLQACPEAALVRDNIHNLPIDYAMMSNHPCLPISAHAFEMLLSHTPHVTINDVWRNCGSTNWKARMQALSYFQRLDNEDQLPPLHAIMQCHCKLEPQHYLESIDKFRGKQHISHVDHKGRLPLHVALEPSSLVPPRVIAKMVEMEPRALMVRHPSSGLYPWMMTASRKYLTYENAGEILSAIYTALRTNPTPFLSSLHERMRVIPR